MVWDLTDGGLLAAEIDGREHHDTLEAAYEDRARQNSLVVAGVVRILRFTAQDLACTGVASRTIAAALASAGRR
jgi:very-short-patch-repair endonuclease